MSGNNTVSIYFSKAEYEKIEKASQYSILGWNPLAKIFIKNGMDDIGTKDKVIFAFDINKLADKKAFKTKVVRLDDEQYQLLEGICACTPFSMSNLVKYLIMPQVDELIEKKGLNYKP